MPDKPSDLVQGHARYAYPKSVGTANLCMVTGFPLRIEQMSKGRLSPQTRASLFFAIQRLERDGLIDGEWKPAEKQQARGTTPLTAKGRKRLNAASELASVSQSAPIR